MGEQENTFDFALLDGKLQGGIAILRRKVNVGPIE